MPRIREEYDADIARINQPTEYKTESNRHSLPCEVCGKPLYIDTATLESYERALAHDIENRFICNECEEEGEELAH